MEGLDRALTALAADQAGLLSRSQLLRAGVTVGQIRARISAGRWRRVHPGVVATFTGDLPRRAVLWTALLYAGEGATLSHRTAAEVHGIVDGIDETVHVTMPVERRVRPRRGVRIQYAHRLARTRAAGRQPPIVNVDDTVLDLVDRSARPREAIDWVTRACQRRRTTPERLRTALALRKKIRWRAMVVAALTDVASGAETPLELAYLHRVERAHRLPAGVRQRHRKVGPRSQWIDVEYAAFVVRVELDGRIGHVDDGVFRDRHRDNDAAVAGFATLRLGWTDVYHDACASAGQVATVLRLHGWTGEPKRCGPSCTLPALAPFP
ncbi:MAG TPA: type IV toxin-antitoxin system AbiEi family antitoxin domain-containing protein [Streptosporangiales bacterium]